MAKPDPSPRLLRLEDAARYLSFGVKSLRKLVQAGDVPVVKTPVHGDGPNSPWRIDRQDLDRWIEQNKTRLL